jgi:hypothetical protein
MESKPGMPVRSGACAVVLDVWVMWANSGIRLADMFASHRLTLA